MKELIEFMARGLVDDRDAVAVAEIRDGRQTVYELKVAEGETGRVIGKEGKVANAMRALVRLAAEKQGHRRVILDIL